MKTIIINGRSHGTEMAALTYENLLEMAQKPQGSTITWARGPAGGESGSLLPGQSVAVRERQVFNVMHTGGA